MEIIDIFAIVKESLYSVQYEGEELNEFAKCFELWNDPIYLDDFFEKNVDDLNDEFWEGITIDEAIYKTREDAFLLQKELKSIAETGKTDKFETLSTKFKPLSEIETGDDFERDKARGVKRRSWLRIYAIRIEANKFIVCGGAIKLTRTMNTREHLLLELEKFDITRRYLEEEGFDIVELY